MYDHTFWNLQITRSDIRPHIKWAVSLMIAYGHFILPRGFVWVYMGEHTQFITLEGYILYKTDLYISSNTRNFTLSTIPQLSSYYNSSAQEMTRKFPHQD